MINSKHNAIYVLVEATNCLQVPPSWSKLAYASLHGLTSWYADLLLRIIELQSWTNEFLLPTSVWLSGLFNPQSFLTAIMQTTARRQELPLDKMCLVSDVTTITCREDVQGPPKEGVYINGLFMEVNDVGETQA